jgi:proteasome lid subunit RPN8/RPN11
MLLGTPSRRVAGTRRLCHLTAWRLGDLGDQITRLLARLEHRGDDLSDEVRRLSEDWLDVAEINWMTVYENRPEVTVRRDHNSAASWLRAKKVLVLGCGALGAPIAEHCVRAGVKSLMLVDSGLIDPGILVRQPYSDADIGFNKARMLAKRLRAIHPERSVEADRGDAVTSLIAKSLRPEEFDLVIDATADVSVRTTLEDLGASNRASWPPLVTPVIGHHAHRGVVCVAQRGATSRGRDILRRLAIHAHSQGGDWSDVADDLFPHPPRSEMFFPEPGCSAPTFMGSAIQTAGLAAMLLWAAVAELGNDPAADPMIAVAVRLPGADTKGGATSRASWPNDLALQDKSARFEVRLSQRAVTQMRTETRHGSRIRGARVETGGMLLGSVDEATRCVYVDIATAPTPDSVLTTESFDFGTDGSDDVIQHHRQRTHDRCQFAGMWHTHPFGPASPSRRDEVGMAGIVADGTAKWNLMLILGGPEASWRRWCDEGELPEVYVRMVDDGGAGTQVTDSPQTRRVTQVFAGEFSYLPSVNKEGKPTWWQRLRRSRGGDER